MAGLKRAVFLFLAVASLAGPIIGGSAAAVRWDVTNSRTLAGSVALESHDVFVVTPQAGHSISLRLTITGGRADVYAMPPSGYASYTSPSATSFSYFPDRSDSNVTVYEMVVAPNAEQVYVVLDNSNMVGAAPSGDIGYTAVFTDAGSALSPGARDVMFLIGLSFLGAFAIMLLAVVVVLVLRKRREGSLPPPPAAGAPYASLAAPPAAGAPTAPAIPPPTAACPTCGAVVTVGAPSCLSCGMGLSWA